MTVELNAQLQPVGSPITQRHTVDSFSFDGRYERNSVDIGKIKNFSFDSGRGGTLTLGGTQNGNGLLTVKDTAGSTIVTLNNNGIFLTGNAGTAYSQYLFYARQGTLIGEDAFLRTQVGSVTVTDMRHMAFIVATDANGDTYNTQDVTDTGGTRKLFLQQRYSTRGTAFDSAGLNFSLSGAFGAFAITIDGSSGTGYALLPRRASDPAGAAGLVYYNTTTDKFRKYDGGGWSDIA